KTPHHRTLTLYMLQVPPLLPCDLSRHTSPGSLYRPSLRRWGVSLGHVIRRSTQRTASPAQMPWRLASSSGAWNFDWNTWSFPRPAFWSKSKDFLNSGTSIGDPPFRVEGGFYLPLRSCDC